MLLAGVQRSYGRLLMRMLCPRRRRRVPEDPLGRTTPHGTVIGFLRAAEEKDYVKAAKFLDGRRSSEEAGTLTVKLKILMDQGLSTSIDDISRSPQEKMSSMSRETGRDGKDS